MNLGHGAECASIVEVIHALKIGIRADRIIFDSPCKTYADIEFALKMGVHINVDNFDELDRVSELLKKGTSSNEYNSTIGLRINPLVGDVHCSGRVEALAVSTKASKFGVPLLERENLVQLIVAKYPFVRCIHVHTGSGKGVGSYQMIQGIRIAVRLWFLVLFSFFSFLGLNYQNR